MSIDDYAAAMEAALVSLLNAYAGARARRDWWEQYVEELSEARRIVAQLSAERPSCATCKWARECTYDGMVYCVVSSTYVYHEKHDGVCLWEARS